MDEISRILSLCENGEPEAMERLMPVVYDELRRMASIELSRERPGQTLQATALVHEVWLRLAARFPQSQVNSGLQESESEAGEAAVLTKPWESRAQFFAAAGLAMRRILVEAARRKGRVKRGGGNARVDLSLDELPSLEPREDVIELDAALEKLAVVDHTAAQLVQLRYFAGLTIEEAAKIIGIPRRTADRRWVFARAWLFTELGGSENLGS